ncbi:MAG: hypothetical protein JWN74_1585 [Acidobacteriaceae bacterium]|nr:hypothetical protein [Acidobacteriaceae bacterium]
MLENAGPLRPRVFTRVCLLLTRAVVPLVAFLELFFFAAVFFGADAFFADFFAALVFCLRLAVGFTVLPTAFFDLVDFFLFFFLVAIGAV